MIDQVNFLLKENKRLRSELEEETKECNDQAALVVMFANRWDRERQLSDKLAEACRTGHGVDNALDVWHEVRYG